MGSCLKNETKTKEKYIYDMLAWDTVLSRVIRNYNLYSFGFVVIETDFKRLMPGFPGSLVCPTRFGSL